MRGEQAVAETVEIVDPQSGRPLNTNRALEAVAQLGRSPDVVCQDEDVLGRQVRILIQKESDALDHDGRLACTGAREDHERPLAPLDRPALFFGEPVTAGPIRSCVLHRQ